MAEITSDAFDRTLSKSRRGAPVEIFVLRVFPPLGEYLDSLELGGMRRRSAATDPFRDRTTG